MFDDAAREGRLGCRHTVLLFTAARCLRRTRVHRDALAKVTRS